MLFINKLFNSIACLLSFINLQLVIPGRTWILLYLGRTVYKRLWACLALYLADFVSMIDIVQKYKPITSDDEQSINEYSSDEENKNDNKNIFPIKLPNNKIMKLRKKCKIIRFVNYKFKIDPENYCREKLLLYIPWINNELNILQSFTTYIEA